MLASGGGAKVVCPHVADKVYCRKVQVSEPYNCLSGSIKTDSQFGSNPFPIYTCDSYDCQRKSDDPQRKSTKEGEPT